METQRTHVVILQHPHESRHKLCTVPLLTRCLSRCLLLQGRSLLPHITSSSSSVLHHLLHSSSSSIALLLFPSPSSIPIHLWFSSHLSSPCSSCLSPSPLAPHPNPIPNTDTHPSHPPPPFLSHNSISLPRDPVPTTPFASPPSPSRTAPADPPLPPPHFVLIAMDGTWQHAQEMVKASSPFLSSFAVPVCLPYDAEQDGSSIYDSDVILRKEPFKGCMTTLEAIASCLRILEPDGIAIYDKLMAVLRAVVKFQASNIVTCRDQKSSNSEG